MKHLPSLLLSVLALATTVAVADGGIRQEQVEFKKGESGATIRGTIKGDQTVDYQLRAGAGQVMVVKFKPTNASAYFNVLPAGSDEALFIGSTLGNYYSGTLPAAGTYTIRVYLMRNAARRNETANYTLDIGISAAVKKSATPAAGATSKNSP